MPRNSRRVAAAVVTGYKQDEVGKIAMKHSLDRGQPLMMKMDPSIFDDDFVNHFESLPITKRLTVDTHQYGAPIEIATTIGEIKMFDKFPDVQNFLHAAKEACYSNAMLREIIKSKDVADPEGFIAQYLTWYYSVSIYPSIKRMAAEKIDTYCISTTDTSMVRFCVAVPLNMINDEVIAGHIITKMKVGSDMAIFPPSMLHKFNLMCNTNFTGRHDAGARSYRNNSKIVVLSGTLIDKSKHISISSIIGVNILRGVTPVVHYAETQTDATSKTIVSRTGETKTIAIEQAPVEKQPIAPAPTTTFAWGARTDEDA